MDRQVQSDEDYAALQELWLAEASEISAHGKISLNNTVAMTLGNHATHRGYTPRSAVG